MKTNLERFTAGAIEALYFTEVGDEGQPPADALLEAECLKDYEADCRSFWRRFGCFIEAEDGPAIERAGHDFWFTRMGHGAGFWDGDWPTYGTLLTEASEAYGDFYPTFDEESYS